MDLSRFQDLPDEARVWIHGFEAPLSAAEQDRVRTLLADFCRGWQSHGRPVQAAFDVWLDRFLVTAAWVGDGVSGCSTDSFIRTLQQLQSEGIDGLNGGLIYYRDQAGALQAIDHLEFEQVVDNGQIAETTTVYDTLARQLGDLRAGRFELPFSESWHSRRYRLAASDQAV